LLKVALNIMTPSFSLYVVQLVSDPLILFITFKYV